MEEIIALLRNDKVLWDLLGRTPKGLPRMYPFGEGSGIEECITYEANTVTDNGIKAVDRLELTVVCFSIGKSNEALKRIKGLILTVGDKSLTNKVLKIEQNGGGSLSNTVGNKTMYHTKAYFNIVRRV